MRKINFTKIGVLFLSVNILFTTSCSLFRNIETAELEKEPIEAKMVVKKANTETKEVVANPIVNAENNTSTAGKAVLETGRKMAQIEKTIVKGSCWDYIYEVFKRAGYGTNKTIVYKGKIGGPFVDASLIQPGDWLYYVNYSYGGVGHSGIFVYWENYEKRIGVTLSYGGEMRNEPGRYRSYDLKSVYYITRPGPK